MTRNPKKPQGSSSPPSRTDLVHAARRRSGRKETSQAPAWDREHILGALNEAADDVLDWCGAADTGARDVVNLVVHTFGAYLGGLRPSIETVIKEAYGEADEDDSPMADQVYDWCNS